MRFDTLYRCDVCTQPVHASAAITDGTPDGALRCLRCALDDGEDVHLGTVDEAQRWAYASGYTVDVLGLGDDATVPSVLGWVSSSTRQFRVPSLASLLGRWRYRRPDGPRVLEIEHVACGDVRLRLVADLDELLELDEDAAVEWAREQRAELTRRAAWDASAAAAGRAPL